MHLKDTTIIGGHFRLLRRLHHHRGATLWEAHDDVAMEPVHLRILDENLRGEPLVTMRFRRELAMAARLKHRGLLAPVELIEDEYLALVYPFAGKETLASRLRSAQPLSPARAVALFTELLDALEHAHRRGLVHRDISPDKIWLDTGGRPRLTGFGHARVLDMVGLTTQSVAFGFTHYQAPEQLHGEQACLRADLFALAMVWLELLTGRPLTAAQSPGAILAAQTSPELCKRLQSLDSPELACALEKALSLDRRERFASARAMSEAVLNSSSAVSSASSASSAGSIADGPLCWSCSKPRVRGLRTCFHCGAGPLVRNPGKGVYELILPKLRASGRTRGRPKLSEIFVEKYHPQLDLEARNTLWERLQQAGLCADEHRSAMLADCPARLVTKLTREDALRLRAFLQTGKLPPDIENEPLENQDAHVEQEVPLLLHRPGLLQKPRATQDWTMRGLRWESPFFFVAFFLAAVAITGFVAFSFLWGAIILILPFWVCMGFLSAWNRRVVADFRHTGVDLLPEKQAQKLATLTGDFSSADRALLHELLTLMAQSVKDGSPWMTRKMGDLLNALTPDLQALAGDPSLERWTKLQAALESSPKELKVLEPMMQQEERAREKAALARARILQVIDTLQGDCKEPDTPDPARLESLDVSRLRALHQSLLEVEDRPRFDDIEPRKEAVDLGLKLPERFDPIRILASGGVAQIVVAYDHYREERVALKVPHAPLRGDESVTKSLQKEYILSRRVQHPALVNIHECLELDETLILVMDYEQSVDLKTILRTGGALPQHTVRRMAEELLDVLATLHESGHLHGDIKPANILVDEKDRIKLVDLGLARSPHQTSSDELRGTLHYIAPELLASNECDETADLYSLALTLVEALTGELAATDDLDSLFQAMELDEDFARTLAMALERDPTRRPLSARRMKLQLTGEQTLHTDSLQAQPLQAETCTACEAPRIPGLHNCIECGQGLLCLQTAGPLKGRQLVLATQRRGLLPGFSLTAEEARHLTSVLADYENLSAGDRSERLQKLPVVLTPPLCARDAEELQSRLKEKGLSTWNLPGFGIAPLTQLGRWVKTATHEMVPALAIMPVFLFFVFFALFFANFDPGGSGRRGVAIPTIVYFLVAMPVVLWFGLLLRTAAAEVSPVTKVFARSTAGEEQALPWASRFHDCFARARTTRSRALLRELASAAARLPRSRATTASLLTEDVDDFMERALQEAEALVESEQCLLDFDAEQATLDFELLQRRVADSPGLEAIERRRQEREAAQEDLMARTENLVVLTEECRGFRSERDR